MIERINEVLTISGTMLQRKDLSWTDKLIYAVIFSLDKEKGCYATNEEIAKVCGCSKSTVSRAISKLTKSKDILVSSFDGRNRCLKVISK